jgi:hypothetical protein
LDDIYEWAEGKIDKIEIGYWHDQSQIVGSVRASNRAFGVRAEVKEKK